MHIFKLDSNTDISTSKHKFDQFQNYPVGSKYIVGSYEPEAKSLVPCWLGSNRVTSLKVLKDSLVALVSINGTKMQYESYLTGFRSTPLHYGIEI